MNNEIIEIIKKRNLHPIGYERIKSVYVIHEKDKSLVIKLNANNYDIYKYLVSKNFLFFPKNFNNELDNYDISLYVNSVVASKEEKINNYIKILAILHQKTSYKREINLDEIKEMYERLNNQIIDLKKYYLELNDEIDHSLFFSPSEYLLIRNISLIYSVLDNCEIELKEIYQKIKDEKSIRISLLHNNVDIEHLIVNDYEYLISWNKSYFDNPINEIEEFYRKYYNDISLPDLLEIYENINKLTDLEKRLLIINLAIPKKLELTINTYSDTKLINDEINYLKNVYELLIK